MFSTPSLSSSRLCWLRKRKASSAVCRYCARVKSPSCGMVAASARAAMAMPPPERKLASYTCGLDGLDDGAQWSRTRAGLDLRTPVWIANGAVLGEFRLAGGCNAFEEGAVGALDADEVVGAEESFIEHASLVLGEVVIVARFENAIALEKTPRCERNLLRIEIRGRGSDARDGCRSRRSRRTSRRGRR